MVELLGIFGMLGSVELLGVLSAINGVVEPLANVALVMILPLLTKIISDMKEHDKRLLRVEIIQAIEKQAVSEG